MSRSYGQMPRRPSARRARVGIKTVNELTALREHPVTRRWLETLEASIDPTVRDEGESFAREGMVNTIDVSPGAIEGVVQLVLPILAPHPPTGSMQPAPPLPPPTGALFNKGAATCNVSIHVPRHGDDVWNEAVISVASDSAAVAPLLAGELPADIDDLLARHAAPLAPRRHEAVRMSCSCDDPKPCKHIAAMVYLFADRLHEQPTLALSVRGMQFTELLDRLRHVRAAAARRSASAEESQAVEQQSEAALDVSLEEFWRTGPELDDLAQLPPPSHAPHALLRRLGPSPLGGTFPLVGLLASAYDTIRAYAEKLRDDAEQEKE